jgi:peptidoglycan/xylan/chitin deacetylase (PgdA/CDA1 family)
MRDERIAMPSFNLEEYGRLVAELRAAGYALGPVTSEASLGSAPRMVFVRHDVDLHLRGVEQMARLEAEHDVRATYYVPLTLHFNLLYPENREILCEICACGHEIGLHYDAATYPSDPAAAQRHLEWEVALLSALCGAAVRTVCMHNPSIGGTDPFSESSSYVNPGSSFFQKDCLYVSDSCRAWRDDSLLRCFGDSPPRRVLLNAHPELWLRGDVREPLEYVDKVLRVAGIQQNVEYFDAIRTMWVEHAARSRSAARERDLGDGGNSC